MSRKITALVLGFIFFVMGLATLPDYGINWDTINHLPRGQAYLNYFLTGRRDFSNLPEFFSGWQKEREWYWQNPKSLSIDADVGKASVPRRSLYQNDATTFDWFMEHDGKGHPPLSDILSSFFNLVFFQKLRLVNDIDSYRIYGIFLAAALVGLVYWWTGAIYGNFAGLVAAISLGLYPLFWSESHFNTEKDIPLTVFWSFMLFSVWRGITKRNWKWILASGIFFGLALGTKFNILFVPFVILPWLAIFLGYRYIKKHPAIKKTISKNKKVILASIVAPLIGFAVFIASWPYLWPDPIARIGGVIGFYKGLGLTQNVNPVFLGPLGINTYPVQWIFFTTPLVILFLFLLGLIVAIRKVKYEDNKTSLLFLLWFIVPIARVTWPGTTIYGGVRQIMEYIPAMAILAGLGAVTLRNIILNKWVLSKKAASVAILLAFLPITIKLIQIHPNENVFFNQLIGGLSGARDRDIPFWGNSFGAAYRQGVNWINENAENGANVVYAFELIPNIPRIFLRTDLNLHNANRSGYLRLGEYAITLTYEGTDKRSYYDMYLEKFIEPVYQVKVDEVPILKVWKNDDEHLKLDWEERIDPAVDLKKTDFGLRFDLGEERRLSRLEIDYSEIACTPLASLYVQIAQSDKKWKRLPGALPTDWLIPVLGQQPKDGKFIEPFVGQEARYIELIMSPENNCLKQVLKFKVYYFVD